MCPLTPIPGQTGPPWTASDTLFFYGGWLSNFAATPGLRLPFGYTATTRTTACRCFQDSFRSFPFAWLML